MGGIWSRWRKKPSTIEVLEKLEKDIESLEKLRRSNLESQKKIIGRLLLFSVLLYIITACVFYFYYFPENLEERLLYLAPFLAFGFVVWTIKKFLHWYFVKRITKNESALEECKEKKKQILEDVMEKETYKKAKEILEKFDPDRFKKLESTESSPAPQRTQQGQELRQRTVGHGAPSTTQKVQGVTPSQGGGPSDQPVQLANSSRNPQYIRSPYAQPSGVVPPGPPMPRPVLPREKSLSEKLIDALVGDGVQNRYALVCKQCLSHNGMALKEEFEFISFRCCYCYTMNPSRKQKPHAPKLDFSPPTPKKVAQLPAERTAVTTGTMEGRMGTSSESDTDGTNVASKESNKSKDTQSRLCQNIGVEEIKKDQ